MEVSTKDGADLVDVSLGRALIRNFDSRVLVSLIFPCIKGFKVSL